MKLKKTTLRKIIKEELEILYENNQINYIEEMLSSEDHTIVVMALFAIESLSDAEKQTVYDHFGIKSVRHAERFTVYKFNDDEDPHTDDWKEDRSNAYNFRKMVSNAGWKINGRVLKPMWVERDDKKLVWDKQRNDIIDTIDYTIYEVINQQPIL